MFMTGSFRYGIEKKGGEREMRMYSISWGNFSLRYTVPHEFSMNKKEGEVWNCNSWIISPNLLLLSHLTIKVVILFVGLLLYLFGFFPLCSPHCFLQMVEATIPFLFLPSVTLCFFSTGNTHQSSAMEEITAVFASNYMHKINLNETGTWVAEERHKNLDWKYLSDNFFFEGATEQSQRFSAMLLQGIIVAWWQSQPFFF